MQHFHSFTELHNVYVQYKQDTRAVISWLVKRGKYSSDCSSKLSVKNLYSLAETIVERSIDLPDTVDFLFGEAIKARRQLSFFFRTQSQGADTDQNVDHEHFTAW